MAESSDPRIGFMLMVKDPARAAGFYRDGLGFEVKWTADDGSWTVLSAAGKELFLHGNGSGEVVDTGLGLEVDDLDSACRAIVRAGGRVLRTSDRGFPAGAWEDKFAVVTDTEGNRFCVFLPGQCWFHSSLFPEAETASAIR